ncbi:LemA family protein [Bordetella pertussis]|uniref:LemA family protein n=1 Tax=Bordetella pertussis TaxID=520 RepID=UPI0005E1AC2D|nr:LemA family protein [Bordetella pertussis]CFP77154.1 LemA protein [Bordetella pertussis]CFW33483.1 LemA protein [Bordetella pertussis]CPJ56085.1 LemA protein [Bordetella pertussis]CPJ61467.1 LemA protein [Bordetella pertussis]CPJ72994.1 LemA protein [Bordetella pertussis]
MTITRWLGAGLLALLTTLLSGCGYNAIQAADEQVKASWSQVLNQYQRRADLVPRLVKGVDAYMTHERQVLVEVTEARAKVGRVQLTADQLDDPAAVQRFQQAQGELSSALSRLLVVTENYPQLKAEGLFRDLQTELAGTENRLAVERERYVRSVQAYNVLVRQFPEVITAKVFGYAPKANFGVDNEAEITRAPEVKFSNEGGSAPRPAQ